MSSYNPAETHKFVSHSGRDICEVYIDLLPDERGFCGQPKDAAIHRTHKHHVFRPHSSALHHLCGTLAGGKACMKLAADEIHSAIHRADTPADDPLRNMPGSYAQQSARILSNDEHAIKEDYDISPDTPVAAEGEGKPSDKTISSQFHKVWTSQVGTEGYNKKDWQELRRLLDLRGIRV